MSDPVKQPTLLDYCQALVGLPIGLLRPRRPDERFLRSLVDTGLPKTQTVVSVKALRQVPKPVPTALVVEGRRKPAMIENAMTSFLVEHPKARFLIDPSICVGVVERAIAQLPAILRATVRPPEDVVPTVESLRELGGPAVDFALPTHLHWDHVCGLLDLPGLPVHLHRTERAWAANGPVAPAGGVRDALAQRPIVEYDLDGPPVLTFERSHDLFGDNSVVLLDLPGHTPGSVGALLHTTNGWVLIAGDAAWHSHQVEDIRQKSSFLGVFADVDRDTTFRTLHRLHAVRRQVAVVPTHDHEASERLRR